MRLIKVWGCPSCLHWRHMRWEEEESVRFAGLAVSGTGSSRTGGGFRGKGPALRRIIQTDNGSEFGPQFHWHLLDKGIQHRYIRPRRPYLNGKTERSHRIDEEEFYRQLEGGA